MDKIDTAFGALPPPGDESRWAQEPQPQFPPGEFFRQAGFVIAVCLGLAMLAQVLMMIVGQD